MADNSDNPHPENEPSRRAASPQTRAGAIDVTTGGESPATAQRRQSALDGLRQAALHAAGVLPEPTLPAGRQPRFWLRANDQVLIAVLLAAATCLMAVHWVRVSDWGRRPIEIDRLPQAAYLYRIDINTATWVEWAQFDGIGETLARRIVDDRERRGPFESVEDVQRVRGIGPVKFEAMRKHLDRAAEDDSNGNDH
ncbi:MAG: helix-hairpin-helix domain-containing protein [Planctomycetaceae bacterium]|nr:helix-hairpin-helix domain-containing protein [Planctomycetaceae bacterium]